MDRVRRVTDAAKMEGNVTDAIFEEAINLYNILETSDDPALINHSDITFSRFTLQRYHYIKEAREYLQKRWEEDRTTRQKSQFFRRQMKISYW